MKNLFIDRFIKPIFLVILISVLIMMIGAGMGVIGLAAAFTVFCVGFYSILSICVIMVVALIIDILVSI